MPESSAAGANSASGEAPIDSSGKYRLRSVTDVVEFDGGNDDDS